MKVLYRAFLLFLIPPASFPSIGSCGHSGNPTWSGWQRTSQKQHVVKEETHHNHAEALTGEIVRACFSGPRLGDRFYSLPYCLDPKAVSCSPSICLEELVFLQCCCSTGPICLPWRSATALFWWPGHPVPRARPVAHSLPKTATL